jgi:indolepyruvate decarboxylase
VELSALAEVDGRGATTFGPVHIKDVLEALTREAVRAKTPSFSRPLPIPASGASSDRVTNPSVYSRIQQFLTPGDIVIADPGTASGALAALLLPEGVDFHTQTALWACIGWGTPAALGVALAAPSRRVIMVGGDGAHQLTANQIGVMGRYGVNPIILLLNNGIFGVEEIAQGNSDSKKVHTYDKLALWQYHKLPEAMGCRDWFCTSVATNAELDSALQKTRKLSGASYIEIQLGSENMVAAAPPQAIDRMYQANTPNIAT